MGIVYLAKHVSLDRQVALKVLSNERARTNSTLSGSCGGPGGGGFDHPNIVRCTTSARGRGHSWSWYVEGTNVHDMITKTGPSTTPRPSVHGQAAAGLYHAHEKGFVHRDVKPANLMVTKTGTIKLLDLGLARSLTNEEDNLTGLHGNDDITGTPDFISPEQLLGEPCDARTDIYSLGATLFALISGHPPFAGTTTQKLAQHQSKDPAELRKKLRGKAPVELADVIVKMMAKRKADRYQSVDVVIDALTQWLPVETTGNVVRDTAAESRPKRSREQGGRRGGSGPRRRRQRGRSGWSSAARWGPSPSSESSP